jgi:hypothetical protein
MYRKCVVQAQHTHTHTHTLTTPLAWYMTLTAEFLFSGFGPASSSNDVTASGRRTHLMSRICTSKTKRRRTQLMPCICTSKTNRRRTHPMSRICISETNRRRTHPMSRICISETNRKQLSSGWGVGLRKPLYRHLETLLQSKKRICDCLLNIAVPTGRLLLLALLSA